MDAHAVDADDHERTLRARLLSQRVRLDRAARELHRAAARLRSSEDVVADLGVLRRSLRELTPLLDDHQQVEQQVVLRTGGRDERLRSEHSMQGRVVRAFAQLIESPSAEAMVVCVVAEQLAQTLHKDLQTFEHMLSFA